MKPSYQRQYNPKPEKQSPSLPMKKKAIGQGQTSYQYPAHILTNDDQYFDGNYAQTQSFNLNASPKNKVKMHSPVNQYHYYTHQETGAPGIRTPPQFDSYLINFAVKYETIVGENLVVVGNIEELGKWCEYKFPLVWTDGHVWRSPKPLIINSSTF